VKLVRSFSMIVLGAALAAQLSIGCAAPTDDAAASPADEDEVRSKSGRLETFEDGARFGVALVANDGERLLTVTERFADRAAAEAGAIPLLAHGSTEYAYFLRQEMNGEWHLDLFNNGHVVAATHPYRTEADAKRGGSLARALLRRLPFPEAAKATFGQARFQLTFEKDKQHHFRLLDKNGAELLRSEPYRTLSSALKGTDSVRLYSGDERTFQLTPKGGKVQLSIMAYNGETVAWGQVYASKADAERAAGEIRALLERGVPNVE
jgi:uncharacterized protein YegP (UPF0339 family)